MPDPLDAVFKALADPTRRAMLDRLRERNGQTLRELCERLSMARQSATQHLDLLVAANLVSVVRRGRERLHYLNPVLIHEVERRWIAEFDRPRLHALADITTTAQEYAMSETAPSVDSALQSIPSYVYVTYIHASAEQVWRALTDADITARYWNHANVSDWQAGSGWEHRRVDGSGAVDVSGTVVNSDPPHRLVITFEDDPDAERAGGPSVVTFAVEPTGQVVKLTVTHENLPNLEMLNGISSGWPAVLANLKTLLETGDVLPQQPWVKPATH